MLDSNFNLEMQANTKDEFKEVTFFKNPLIVTSTTIILIYEQLMKLIKFFLSHTPLMIVTIISIILSLFDGPHKEVMIKFKFQYCCNKIFMIFNLFHILKFFIQNFICSLIIFLKSL